MLACGEACANAIEHAYVPGAGLLRARGDARRGPRDLTVRDTGRWRAPRGAHRGRGLKMIEAAVDELEVTTTDAGTVVIMRHRIAAR